MDPRIHLQVAIERDHEPICGTLVDSAGTTYAFTGWMELMSAFDNARYTADAYAAEPPSDHA
ncbi:MAG TPA: hypothetical protein VNT54_06405 [Solirubrobacteraceae bacterium]|nr:hypothetical protein [Solirubrobacteraceae bacterium]